ncbi:hypothetical protein PYCC9005_004157 [Savitreella phatthalungensis]
MGSFSRTTQQKRQHRERAQPFGRQKFGLLEKKKDYVLRARDYADKQARLKALRGKAERKNEDEYYHGMVHATTRKGVQTSDRGNTALTQDQVKILKSQDAKYVRFVASVEAKKLDKSREARHFAGGVRNHVSYSDGQGPKTEGASRTSSQPTESKSEPDAAVLKARAKARAEEEARLQRLEKIKTMEKQVALHRHLATKGARRKVGVDADGTPKYKWKQERRR